MARRKNSPTDLGRLVKDLKGTNQGLKQRLTKFEGVEESLNESEARFRTLVEGSNDIVWEVDAKGTYTYVSPNVSSVMGYRPTEMLGKTPFDFMPTDEARRVGEIFGAIASEKKPFTLLAHAFVAKDGLHGVMECSGRPILDKGGHLRGYRGIDRDITDRKQAEETIQNSEDKYRRLFQSAIDMIHIVDDQHRIIDVNETELRKLGYSRSELIGRPLLDIIHPEFRPVTAGGVPTVRSGQSIKSYETALLTKDGGRISVLANVVPLMVDGRFVGAQAIIHDITDRKQAEEDRARFRLLLDQAHDAVFIADPKVGLFLDVNQTAVEKLGYSREELLTMTPRDIEVGFSLSEPEWEKFMNRIRSTNGAVLEGVHRRKDGTTFPVEISLMIKQIESREYQVAIVRDISERKELEKAQILAEGREQVEQQLRQAQRVESLGQLAGGIAHDFNNLLTIINGYTEMSLGNLAKDDPIRGNLDEVRKAGDRAAALTRQLLAFGRKQILRPRVVDLDAVVAETEKMLKRLIGEHIELVNIRNKGLWPITIDPAQIDQVIVNLAVNARDAMPMGGKIIIESKNVELDEEYASKHISVRPGPYVMLAVSDTGSGMDKETLAHLFEPFFTTKEPGKGTGMGLATVYGNVKQSEGNVWVYSEVGKGTTFKLYFPRVDRPVDQPEPRRLSTQTTGRGETVLLVEDDEAVRMLARGILEKNGYTVIVASNGTEALEKCRTHKGVIQLLITDVVMPQMGGPELVYSLSGQRPETKVLYMSGYASKGVVQQKVIEEGAQFLQKPFTPTRLAQKVRDVLDAPEKG